MGEYNFSLPENMIIIRIFYAKQARSKSGSTVPGKGKIFVPFSTFGDHSTFCK
jgi:hypothetical protein